MPSKSRKWKVRTQHIVNAITENLDYVQGMSYEQFSEDKQND